MELYGGSHPIGIQTLDATTIHDESGEFAVHIHSHPSVTFLGQHCALNRLIDLEAAGTVDDTTQFTHHHHRRILCCCLQSIESSTILNDEIIGTGSYSTQAAIRLVGIAQILCHHSTSRDTHTTGKCIIRADGKLAGSCFQEFCFSHNTSHAAPCIIL